MLKDEIAGRSSSDKIRELRDEIKKKSAHGFVANMLDETAWLFNLRGTDVPYNPVFFSFALVLLDKVLLYVNDSQLTDDVKSSLSSEVTLRPYSEFYHDLHKVGAELGEGHKILIGKSASLAVQEALGGANKVEIVRSIVGDQKSIKNETELEGFRQSHIRDGAALCHTLLGLKSSFTLATRSLSPKVRISSASIVRNLTTSEERVSPLSRQPVLTVPSFTTPPIPPIAPLSTLTRSTSAIQAPSSPMEPPTLPGRGTLASLHLNTFVPLHAFFKATLPSTALCSPKAPLVTFWTFSHAALCGKTGSTTVTEQATALALPERSRRSTRHRYTCCIQRD